MSEESLIAVFVDFENLALGVRDMKSGNFQVNLILKRLLEKGRIVFKRAYCDWSQYRNDVREFHQQGIEMVDIPRSKMSGKNSADIHMVVDALDLCYSKNHIDAFALLTGDSDFSPLVSKLKENNKRVIGCGVKNSTSNLLINNCDEFIYYDDLVRDSQKPRLAPKQRKSAAKAKSGGGKKAESAAESPATGEEGEKQSEALDQLLEIVRSLELEYDPLWGSLIKQTIRRVYPGFNERYYGYKNFADLLEDAEDLGYLRIDYDEGRGNYKVRSRDD
ncbi:MAG: NYN domain-containing protein [Deltaproteobacteria bacterium]|nr:NYN domain-containing protein [Deltaproteobacteria bacterium]